MTGRVLVKSHRIELVEKNSRFIGIGCISQSLNEFKLQKDEVDAEFSDANHVTFAYRIYSDHSMHTRFYDDGEPSGTAGKPILMHLEGNQIINTTFFVVRYFGGIKLGAGGLVKAYGNTARQLILEGSFADYFIYKEFTVTIPYAEQTRLEYLLKKFHGEIANRTFDVDVCVAVKMPDAEFLLFKNEVPAFYQIKV